MPLRTGLVRFVAPYLATDSTIAIAGESAAGLAEDLVRNGSAPLSVEADHFALLSDALDPPAVGRVRDLPDESVDLVILRRAWRSRADVAAALSTAVRAVRPGGEVIATDIDVNQLLAGPSPRYPIRLLYLAEPMAASGLRSSTVAPGVLGTEAVRAGLSGVESLTYNDDRGAYESIAEFWSEVQKRGWRGAAWVSQDRSRSLFEDVARSMAGAHPVGWAIDREPWYAVIGRRR
jgi:SAM-dependent methyltransferase